MLKKIFFSFFLFYPVVFFSEVHNIAKESEVKEFKKFVLIIPSYNNQNYIKKNLSSVLNQKYPNFRFIYIDDASTDETYNLAQKLVQDAHFSRRKISL